MDRTSSDKRDRELTPFFSDTVGDPTLRFLHDLGPEWHLPATLRIDDATNNSLKPAEGASSSSSPHFLSSSATVPEPGLQGLEPATLLTLPGGLCMSVSVKLMLTLSKK